MITANRTFLDTVCRIAKRVENGIKNCEVDEDEVDLTCDDTRPESETDNDEKTESKIEIKTKFEVEEYDDHDISEEYEDYDISWTELTRELFNVPDIEVSFHEDGFSYYESCAQSLCNATRLILQEQRGSLQDDELLDDFSNPSDVTILEKVVATCAAPSDKQEQADTDTSISSKTAKHFNKKIMTERCTDSPDLLSSPLQKMNLYRKCQSERPCKTGYSRTKDKQIEIKCELNDMLITDCEHEESEFSATQKMRQRKRQTVRQQTSHPRRRSMQREESGRQRSIEKAVSKSPTIHRNNYSLRSKDRSIISQNDLADDQSETDTSFLSKKTKHSSKMLVAYSPCTSPVRSTSSSRPRGKYQSELPHKSRTRGVQREFKIEENDERICQQDEELEVPLPPWRCNMSNSSLSRKPKNSSKKAANLSSKRGADSHDTSPMREPSISSLHHKCQSERPHKKVQSRIKSKQSKIMMEQNDALISECQRDGEDVSGSSNLLVVPHERYNTSGSSSSKKSRCSSNKAVNLSSERGTDSLDTSPVRDRSISSRHRKCQSERPHKKIQSRINKNQQSKIEKEQDDELISECPQDKDLASSSSKASKQVANLSVERYAVSTDTSPVPDASVSSRHRQCQSERLHKKVRSYTKSQKTETGVFSATLSVPAIEADIFDNMLD